MLSCSVCHFNKTVWSTFLKFPNWTVYFSLWQWLYFLQGKSRLGDVDFLQSFLLEMIPDVFFASWRLFHLYWAKSLELSFSDKETHFLFFLLYCLLLLHGFSILIISDPLGICYYKFLSLYFFYFSFFFFSFSFFCGSGSFTLK